MTTPSATLKTLAMAAIVATGLIHLDLARVAYGAVHYLGVLFVAAGIGALVAAVGIYRNQAGWGWLLGLLVAAGTMLGYVLSRTVGLPGLSAMPGAWFDPLGVASLACEGLFILLFALARREPAQDILAAGGIRRGIGPDLTAGGFRPRERDL
jgi:hypothetical protein